MVSSGLPTISYSIEIPTEIKSTAARTKNRIDFVAVNDHVDLLINIAFL